MKSVIEVGPKKPVTMPHIRAYVMLTARFPPFEICRAQRYEQYMNLGYTAVVASPTRGVF